LARAALTRPPGRNPLRAAICSWLSKFLQAPLSYQAGVYRALHEVSIEPDRVIGTSIGAINASLIAGGDENRSSLHTGINS
jgi:hypothetical protein